MNLGRGGTARSPILHLTWALDFHKGFRSSALFFKPYRHNRYSPLALSVEG